MGDFDNLLARIGMQIEEMKKRIRSSRELAGHHRDEARAHQAERSADADMERLQRRTEKRPDEAATRR